MPLYYPFFDNTYLVFVLIPVLISVWASARVNSTFKKYSDYRNARNLTAAEVTRMILDRNGQQNVRIERVGGSLTDHYDPRDNTIRLSEERIRLDLLRGNWRCGARGGPCRTAREGLCADQNPQCARAGGEFCLAVGGTARFARIYHGAWRLGRLCDYLVRRSCTLFADYPAGGI